MLNAQYFSPDLSMELFPTLLNLKCNLKLIQIIFTTNKDQYQSQTNIKTSLNIHGLETYYPSDITSQTKIDGNILIALKYI